MLARSMLEKFQNVLILKRVHELVYNNLYECIIYRKIILSIITLCYCFKAAYFNKTLHKARLLC
jgi:hypothetical protein